MGKITLTADHSPENDYCGEIKGTPLLVGDQAFPAVRK